MPEKAEKPGFSTYTILDAARIFSELATAQMMEENFIDLYRDESMDLSTVSPHLFAYKQDSNFAGWLFEKGWGNNWGIFLESPASAEDLYTHFRKFIHKKTAAGQDFYYRFYDPRVLRKILPAYDPQQLIDFFGPVNSFFCENENPEEVITYTLEQNKLKAQKSPAAELFKPAEKAAAEFSPGAVEAGDSKQIIVTDLKAGKTARKFFD